MRVRCEVNTGATLGAEHLSAGYTERSKFHVTTGAVYAVHGMCLMRSVVCYLLENDLGQPEWIPAAAFEVVDAILPRGWRFDYSGPNPGLVEAVWGYEELVEWPGHFDQLSMRQAEAVELFRKRTRTVS